MTDNRKWQYGHQNRKYIHLGTIPDRMRVPTANMGFSTMPSSKKLTPDDCETAMTDNRKWYVAPKPEIIMDLELWQIG